MIPRYDPRIRVEQLEYLLEQQVRELEAVTQERDNAITQGDVARVALDVADQDLRALEIDAANLEVERDKALLRIEELERRSAPQPFSGPEFLYRAVHPNA